MHWLIRLFRKEQSEKQLDSELRFHLEQQIAGHIAEDMTPEEARRRANLEFGGLESIKQQTREARRANFIDTLLQDLRYALRTLRKNPGFTAIAILTLALGIGANTAIFSLIDTLMLRRLPMRDPGQLVELLHRFPNEPASNGFSGEAYQLMRDQNHVFSGLIADGYRPFNVRDVGLQSQTVTGGYVDGTFFAVLGLKPEIGRLIGPEDDSLARPSSVAVVSWRYWKSKFNLDPQILGKQITVDDVPVTVVGVAPRGFLGLGQEFSQDVWLPLAMEPAFHHALLGWGSLVLVGRLRPSVSIEQARAEMAVLWHSAIQAPYGNPFLRNMKLELEPAGPGLSSALRQQFSTPLLVLMAIVSLLLLIACSSVASLLLARGAARQHETGVRVCLGAGRLRLVRQVLTESLLLSAIGSLLGIALAYFGVHGLVRIMASGRAIPGSSDHAGFRVEPDLQVLLFTGAVALLTGLLFGVAPAIRALRTAPVSALRQSGRTGDTGFQRLFGKSLVVTQVALSLVLLSAAALFIGYLSNLEHLDLGFQRDHLLLVSLDPSHSGLDSAQLLQQFNPLVQKLEAIPGVRSVALSSMTPVSGSGQACYCLNVEGHEEAVGDHHILTLINRIGPNYFKTYSTPLLAGREFSAQDNAGPRVAIVNRAMARGYFGDLNPIGRHFNFDKPDEPYEIVGVVGDARYNEIREDERRTVYLNIFQVPFHVAQASSQFTLRTSLDPKAAAPEVRRIVNSTLKTVSIARITTMADQVDASIVPERLIATLSGCFGVLGALLAAIGLYGLLAYAVARRTNEIGIRMALGATRSDVMQMVLREASGLVGVGLAIGAPLAFWGKRIATSLIQDLPAKNAVSIVLGAIAMLAVALLAAYFPARRAMRVDPMVALRYE